MAVDLHIHSTVSDGTLTPQQIVQEALQIGLYAIALADHDAVDGIEPALQAARGTNLLVLPAVEISTEVGNTEVHILGYYIDYHDDTLLDLLRRIREDRQQRAQKMVNKLNRLGVKVSYEAVAARAGTGSVGRPHVAAAIVEAGYAGSQEEAFARYLRRGRPAYVPRYKLTPRQAVQQVRAAGGLPVLAHPGLVHQDSIIDRLVPDGLGGIEVYHVNHSASEVSKYRDMAVQRGLIITGGTDSHGPGGPNPVPIGAIEIPDECADAILHWARAHGRL